MKNKGGEKRRKYDNKDCGETGIKLVYVKNKKLYSNYTWKTYKLLSKFKVSNYQNNQHTPQIVRILNFLWEKKIILEYSLILLLSDFVENGFDVFCQMHTPIIYVHEALFLNGLISSSRKIYAFAEPVVFQQGAIEHTYKLIACLFTSVSKWGENNAAATKIAKTSEI